MVEHGGEPPGGVEHRRAAGQLHAGQATASHQNPPGAPGGQEFDLLAQRLFDILGESGHLVAPLQASDRHFRRPEAQARDGHVQGHVAPADHQHPAANPGDRPLAYVPQEVQPRGQEPLVGQAQGLLHPGSRGQEHPVVAAPQGGQRQAPPPDPGAQAEGNAHAFEGGHLATHDRGRQPVGRNPVDEHPPGLGHGVEHGDVVAQAAEEVGGREPRRPGAHHCHVPAGAPARGPIEAGGVLQDVVADPALHRAHGHRLVVVVPVAAGLAVVRADPPGDRRDRVALQHHGGRSVPVPLPQQAQVGRNVDVGRAIPGAGGLDGPHRPEDGVVTVLPHHRRAGVAALAGAVELVLRVPVVPAAGLLADIAAHRGHVADLR